MSRIIDALVPPSGWHYIQDGIRIPPERADSLQDLLKRVLEYRLHNKIPVGDVFNDVQTYICQFPNQCHAVFTGVIQNDAHQVGYKPNFVHRLITWADALRSNPVTCEANHHTEEKRMICKQCPKATNWGGMCPACASTLMELLTLIRRGVQQEEQLGCKVYEFDTQTAAMMDPSKLPRQQKDDVPDQCWRKRAL